jgi:MoaA/NifB/PqqE/SkfB family radical SAM enzyme
LIPLGPASKLPLARRLDWLRHGPFHVQLVVIRRCNLSCAYCNEFDDHSDPIPAEVLERRIDRIAELGTLAIEFTGGEPLMHPELPRLIAYATQKGFVQRKMITNAYLISPDKIEELNRAGLTHMQISLDGAKPNDVTVKVLKPLERKLEHVKKHADFLVTLSGVIGAAPASEVREVIEFAEKNGFRPRVLLIHDGDGQFKLSKEEQELFWEVEAKLGARWKQAWNYRGRLLEHGKAPFKCRAGSRYLYVDEHGMVRWCSQTREVWGKDLMAYGWDDLEQQFNTVKSCNEQCTVGCVRNNSKVDEWRPQKLIPALSRRLPVVH